MPSLPASWGFIIKTFKGEPKGPPHKNVQSIPCLRDSVTEEIQTRPTSASAQKAVKSVVGPSQEATTVARQLNNGISKASRRRKPFKPGSFVELSDFDFSTRRFLERQTVRRLQQTADQCRGTFKADGGFLGGAVHLVAYISPTGIVTRVRRETALAYPTRSPSDICVARVWSDFIGFELPGHSGEVFLRLFLDLDQT